MPFPVQTEKRRSGARSRPGWIALFVCLCALLPLSAQAQVLEQLIASALASHPAAQGQRALVESSQAGVDSARWQFLSFPRSSVGTHPMALQRPVVSLP